MSDKMQADFGAEDFALSVKTTLLERRWSVTELARRVGKPRPTVSTAIHKGRFPRVREKIQEVLRGS